MATLVDSADYLSKVASPGETLLLTNQLEAIPVGADHISDWTASDPVLQVQTKVQHGWGDKCPGKSLAALLCERRQTELTKWVHIVVKLCGHYQQEVNNSCWRTCILLIQEL